MAETPQENYEDMTDEEILGLVGPDVSVMDDEPAETDIAPLESPTPAMEKVLETVVEEEVSVADEDLGDAPAKAVVEDEDAPEAVEVAPNPDDLPDFKVAYERIMKPFKANGKDFTPQDPDDVIRLMQMGANYTKKMQGLAPSLKLIRMLENNNLLTEEKLTYLIDLDRKDPTAIQKLLHDGNLDPLDLDASSPPAYVPGNHSVSDQEMQFQEVLEDMMSSPEGQETVTLVNNSWDQTSKEALYREPSVLKIITEQRSNGIYNRISSEIDRQKILGNLENIPFIQAYKQVGDALHKQGLLTPSESKSTAAEVLDVRPATVKNLVVNSDKARAASTVRSSPKSAPAVFNPLTMSDEEIMAITSP